MTWEELAPALGAVVVFRNVVQQPPMAALRNFLMLSAQSSVAERAELYGAFVSALFERSCSLSTYLKTALAEDENPYVVALANGKTPPPVLEECAQHELELFSSLTHLDPAELAQRVRYEGWLPRFENTPMDLRSEYAARDVQRCGYGIFANNIMFRLEDGRIVPVRGADPISIDELTGYEFERRQVIDNTRALLAGRPAANILLCGSAGTGKSSTVKATVNLLASEGLRLVELRKEQLLQLPTVLSQLAHNPLKFIIFIDDLSFQQNDDSFGTLKAILEGSTAARGANTVLYATSNRRHLVRETFSDRDGDEVHRDDTMQELLSLSDRFGLTVHFYRPDKALYLRIVHELAREKGVTMAEDELEQRAETYALRRGGRSPRTAAQFTDSLLAGEERERTHADT